MKTIKDMVDEIISTPTTPDTKMFMIVASESEDYFNALCNMDSRLLFNFLYTVYRQSPVLAEAVDLLRVQIDSDIRREQTVMGEPANTTFRSTAAEEAVKKAMEELGGIYTGVSDLKS